jgi:hypothetical protein
MATRFVAEGGSVMDGEVVDADSHAPIKGARVEVWMGTKSMHGETDAAGRFHFEGLVPGSRVKVWVTATPGFVQEHTELTVPADSSPASTQFRLLGRGNGRGRNGGVGIFLGQDAGPPMVTGVTAFGPAERAGILVGDTIISIAGQDVSELGPGGVEHLLSGPIGSRVELVVQTGSAAPRRVTLRRSGGR